MRANVEHNHVRHEHVVIVARRHAAGARVSRTPSASRSTTSAMPATESSTSPPASGTWKRRTSLRALRLLDPTQTEGPIAVDDASYFLSKIELTKGTQPTMAPWRKRLFIATSYLTADAAEYFGLPRDRTVIMGSRIEV